MTPPGAARELWRHPVDGRFLGAFLEVVGGVVVFGFRDREGFPAMAALSPDGKRLWQQRWKGFAFFHVSRERVYVDGDKARRISASTGVAEAERDLGADTAIVWAQAAGPIYRLPSQKRYFGLDGDTLATRWEWAPDKEDFTCHHEGRLCRYREGEGVTIFELPALAPRGPVPTPPMAKFGLHAHVGDLWCQFGSSEGGRAAVDLGTGREAWRAEDPAAYGLVTFDEERAYSPFGGLAAYHLRTGKQAWRREFGEIPTSRARLQDGLLYVATGDKYVHVVEAGSGDVRLSHRLDFEITGTIEPSPAVPYGRDRILVGTQYAIICLQAG
jgi:hypothetical protein